MTESTGRMLTLVFSDLVDSTKLKSERGDDVAGTLIARHRAYVTSFAEEHGGRIVDWAGDGCFLTFETPSAGVLFGLSLQAAHRSEDDLPAVRVGIHMGEVTESGPEDGARVEGLAVDLAARIQSLARPGQILLSGEVFNSARQRLRTADGALAWLAHGPYHFKGWDDPMLIGEVGVPDVSPLTVPEGSEKAQRAVAPTDEDTLGWRPAVGQVIPGRKHWVLDEQLGTGGFGEVWLAENVNSNDKHVFKFCFEPERVRGLKREVVLFRLLKEKLGEREDIARVLDWEFDQSPYFIEAEYTRGGDLKQWAEAKGGITRVPLETRLFIVQQVARALAAAHSAGVLHKDIKPANVLINEFEGTPKACLTDFGIGLLSDPDALKKQGITATGLTETLVAGSSTSTSGTGMYMAPELLEGKPPSEQSDIYALGVLLYQAVVGDLSHALAPGWERDVDDTHLREDIALCVDGNPEHRIKHVSELADRLERLTDRRSSAELNARRARRGKRLRQAALVLVMLAIGAGAVAYTLRNREGQQRELWARSEGLPQIRDHLDAEEYFEAAELIEQVEEIIPDDPLLEDFASQVYTEMTIATDPPGAHVSIKPYATPDAEWMSIGTTPIEKTQLTRGLYRWKIERDGYATREFVERARHVTDPSYGAVTSGTFPAYEDPLNLTFAMFPEAENPAGMTYVDGGGTVPGFGIILPAMTRVDGFFIDRTEVTNAAYQEFIDGGGYSNPDYWQEPFIRDGETVPRAEAMLAFVDSTGRPGPSTWELGQYPEGRGDYPVVGVSWYEAMAYARFRDATLPTLFHWARAAFPRAEIVEPFTPDILPFSNIGTAELAPVASNPGMGYGGAYDVAGNAAEWCLNSDGDRRWTVGGAWEDVSYMFNTPEAKSPWNRDHENGFRCMKPVGEKAVQPLLARNVPWSSRPTAGLEPMSDEAFAVLARRFEYDRAPVRPEVIETHDDDRGLRYEKVLIDGVTGNDDRLLLHVFTPRDATSPVPAVVYWPGIDALSSKVTNLGYVDAFDFIPRSGRAFIFPVYKGTYERGGGATVAMLQSRNAFLPLAETWIKEISRTIDYAEERDDIADERPVLLGLSFGGWVASTALVLESRFSAGIIYSAGLSMNDLAVSTPEINQINYLPRITVPMLLIAGEYDYIFPVETAQQPFMDLLGTPEEDKFHVVVDAGHVPLPRMEVLQNTLEFLDTYQPLPESTTD